MAAYPDNWNATIFPSAQNVDKMAGYLPLLFANKTQRVYHNLSVLAKIVNQEYASQLKRQGDTIYIRQKPKPTVKPYTVGTDLAIEQLSAPDPITLTVDKACYWCFAENDLTTVQTDLKQYVSEAAFEVSKAVQDEVEGGIINAVVTEQSANGDDVGNAGTAAGILSKSFNLGTASAPVEITVNDASPTNLLTDMYTCLAENNALNEGEKPWILAPWRMANSLAKSSLAVVNITGDATSPMRTGPQAIGTVAGMPIWTTNYLKADTTHTTSFPVLVGTSDAITFVMQVSKTESGRMEKQFGNFNRGLVVYGHKIVKPEALAVAWVKFVG